MKSALVVCDDQYEDLELWYPVLRLREEGYTVSIAGADLHRTYTGKHGYPCSPDLSFDQIDVKKYDAIVIPGGYAPDRLRRSLHLLEIIRAFDADSKTIAFICHGGWVAISAGIVSGHHVTGAMAIKDDLVNAGGLWNDQEVVTDANLVSSRTPHDLPYFVKAIIESVNAR